MTEVASKEELERKKRVRRTALLLFAVAAAFYVAFIAVSVMRSRHG